MGTDCRYSRTTNGNCDSLAGVDQLTLASVRSTVAGKQTKAGHSGAALNCSVIRRANKQLADSLNHSKTILVDL